MGVNEKELEEAPESIRQQTVENQATDYNPMVLHLRVVTHCTGIYRNIIVCHFQITDSRQRVITRYNPL